MSTLTIVLLIILAVLVIALVVLYFFGKRAEKKQSEQEAQMKAAAQVMSMLIIDKKRMKLKDAGLPSVVLENTPKYLRGAKMPIVKAKVGPRVMSLICDQKIFDQIPVKKEVKAEVSGLYIIGVRGLRGGLETTKKEKKGFFKKFKK